MPGDFSTVGQVNALVSDRLRDSVKVIARETVKHTDGVLARQDIVIADIGYGFVAIDVASLQKTQKAI